MFLGFRFNGMLRLQSRRCAAAFDECPNIKNDAGADADAHEKPNTKVHH